jgi:hypothetical protein
MPEGAPDEVFHHTISTFLLEIRYRVEPVARPTSGAPCSGRSPSAAGSCCRERMPSLS